MIELITAALGLAVLVAGAVIKRLNYKWQQAEDRANENAKKYAELLDERSRGWASNTPSGVLNAANEHSPIRPPVGRPDKRQRGANPFSGG